MMCRPPLLLFQYHFLWIHLCSVRHWSLCSTDCFQGEVVRMLVGVPGKKMCLVNARLNNVRFSFVTDALLSAGPPGDCPHPGLSPSRRNVSTALAGLLVPDSLWQRTC